MPRHAVREFVAADQLRAIVHVTKGLGWYALWTLAWAPVIWLPPAGGVIWLLACLAFFFWRSIWSRRGDRGYRARFRFRSVTRYTPWILASVPPRIATAICLTYAHAHLALLGVLPPLSDPYPLFDDEYLQHPLGQVADIVLTVGIVPLIEEFAFRGRIQRPLERAWGPVPAIVVSSILFALAHGSVLATPRHMIFGLIAGYAVYVTRSIWAGVLMHIVSNAVATVVTLITGLDADVTSPPSMRIVLAVMIISAVCLIAICRRLLAIARAERIARTAGHRRPVDRGPSFAKSIVESSTL